MSDLTVIDRGNHCEIHQGDAIAADYVASKRLATLFAAAPDMLAALQALRDHAYENLFAADLVAEADRVIAKAKGGE